MNFPMLPFFGTIMPEPKKPALREGDVIELLKLLRRMEENNKTVLNTLAITTQQLIDLRVEVGTFAAESNASRQLRSSTDIAALEGELELLNKRLENLRTGTSGNTTERIKAAVKQEVSSSVGTSIGDAIKVELKKTQIDWLAVRQAVVVTVLCTIAAAVTGILFWQLVQVLAVHAPK